MEIKSRILQTSRAEPSKSISMPSTPSKIVRAEFESKVLKNNPLGDSPTRNCPVYLPPDYNEAKKYPVIYMLAGFTGTGDYYIWRRTFEQSMDQIFDEIIEKGCAPFICVMPNCVTKYGGSQYVNSSATGDYEDYIVNELVPYIDDKFSTNKIRAVMGGSSGGIGAFTLAAKHPDIFCAAANHSGDSAFEYGYLSDVPQFITTLEKFDYKLENFIEKISDVTFVKDMPFKTAVNLMCMCACYLPNPESPLGFDLPFDIRDGKINPLLWEKMIQHDPTVFATSLADNLKKLKFLYLDCGKRDQFHLYLGARRLHNVLKEAKVAHSYEEYDSDHFQLRRSQKKKSIPALIKAMLAPDANSAKS